MVTLEDLLVDEDVKRIFGHGRCVGMDDEECWMAVSAFFKSQRDQCMAALLNRTPCWNADGGKDGAGSI